MSIRVAGFFVGCGGLDLGFHLTGYDVAFASDQWNPAAETYQENFPDVEFLSRDIKGIGEEELEGVEADVVIGGPPCQGFSRLNNREIKLNKMEKDERNTLFEEFLRVVDILEPKVVLMENVKDIITRKTSNGEYVKDNILKAFSEYGYNANYRVLEAQDYGVPQKRKRTFFIGINEDKAISFPTPTHPEMVWVSASEALEGVHDGLPNMTYSDTGDSIKEKMEHIPPGGYYKHLPDKLKEKEYTCDCKDTETCSHNPEIVKRYGTYLRRIDPDKPSLTINTNLFIHPTEDRYLTPREMARLQTFPDDFVFKGSKTDVMKQIGNAVPPELSQKIAEHIKGHFNE